jgi:hypothetical protein
MQKGVAGSHHPSDAIKDLFPVSQGHLRRRKAPSATGDHSDILTDLDINLRYVSLCQAKYNSTFFGEAVNNTHIYHDLPWALDTIQTL